MRLLVQIAVAFAAGAAVSTVCVVVMGGTWWIGRWCAQLLGWY